MDLDRAKASNGQIVGFSACASICRQQPIRKLQRGTSRGIQLSSSESREKERTRTTCTRMISLPQKTETILNEQYSTCIHEYPRHNYESFVPLPALRALYALNVVAFTRFQIKSDFVEVFLCCLLCEDFVAIRSHSRE